MDQDQDQRDGDITQQNGGDMMEETIPNMPADGKSRRNFLKAAVVASAAVVTAGGVAGVALASRGGPQSLLRFANFVASGVCIPLKQGGKFSGSNPNVFIQIDNSYLDSFGTKAATKDANGNYPITLTRCGSGNPINFTLTDKNDSTKTMSGQIVQTGGNFSSYSNENGSSLVLDFAFANLTGNTTNEYPTGSCLTLSC